MNYLSDELKYIKPLSISGYARLYEFQDGVKRLEELFSDMGTTLNSVSLFANEYATVLYFEFNYEDFKILTDKSNRFPLYGHLQNNFPVRGRVLDWMLDDYIQQTLSGIYQDSESNKTVLNLALDDEDYNLIYPSHDFFCLSHDLMATNKVPELQALEA
jgi:hypothetical protein